MEIKGRRDMRQITGETFDEERALYGCEDVQVSSCAFDGPADGESAFKEGSRIVVEDCFFNLRYPFWHDDTLEIRDSNMTELCRAALWYSKHIVVKNTKLHGIKAMRECADVTMEHCDIISPEFGWSTEGITVTDSTATSEYFMMRAKDITFKNVTFSGKYSFQYIENAVFEDCDFQTKDAFWHGNNILVKNSTIKGEYLAWYSKNLTLENCTIIGTQPFCYCENLKLINCKMIETDLAFEKSSVEAEITTKVDSIKNPKDGCIRVPEVGEMIFDDPEAKGQVVLTK